MKWHALTTREEDASADDWCLDLPHSRDTVEVGPDSNGGYSIIYVMRDSEDGSFVDEESIWPNQPTLDEAQQKGERFALNRWREGLRRRILATIDVIAFTASLNPDEVGYGQAHAYSEEFRALIREAKELQERDA